MDPQPEEPAPGQVRVRVVARSRARQREVAELIRDLPHARVVASNVPGEDPDVQVVVAEAAELADPDLPVVWLGWAPVVAGPARPSAVLPVDPSPREMALGIEAVALGYSLGLSEGQAQVPTAGDLDASLTPRELDVLLLLGEGHANKTIAARLGLSENTVKFHVAAILSKFDAQSRTEAVVVGARRGLLSL
ncbi:MAG: response regulator transcription factor [Dehalococcoidia bacterium]